MAKLISIGGIRYGQAYVLRGGVNRIGSEEGNELLIRNPTVSPFHCELTWRSSSLHVRDLGSERGTFVRGVAIHETNLCDGQTLRVGEVEMRLVAEPGEKFEASEPETVDVEDIGLEPEPEGVVETASKEPAPGPRVCTDASGQPVRVSTIRISEGAGPASDESPPETEGGLKFKARDKSGPTVESLLWSSGGPPRPVVTEAPRPPADPELTTNFFAEIPRAFAYPFRSDGIMIILAGAFFFAGIEWIGGLFLLLAIMVAGYIFTAMKGIINATAVGDDKTPDWPEFSSWWDDLLLPFVEFLAIHLVCFLPGWLALIHVTWPANFVVGGLLLLLGFAVAPMALLAVAIFDSIRALNPLLIFISICRVPLEYLVACLTLVATYVFGGVLNSWLIDTIAIPVLPWLLTSVFSLYLLVVEMRILGLLYRCKQKELGWLGKNR